MFVVNEFVFHFWFFMCFSMLLLCCFPHVVVFVAQSLHAMWTRRTCFYECMFYPVCMYGFCTLVLIFLFLKHQQQFCFACCLFQSKSLFMLSWSVLFRPKMFACSCLCSQKKKCLTLSVCFVKSLWDEHVQRSRAPSKQGLFAGPPKGARLQSKWLRSESIIPWPQAPPARDSFKKCFV